MKNINYIRDVLKKYIDQRIERFIIYPFGANGINVKNVLKEFFDLEPSLVVDNEYSKYNSNIINKEELKNVYQKEMYLILTIENTRINFEMVKELSEFIPVENIINLFPQKKITVSDKGFLLKDFLPLPKVLTADNRLINKIKVRIVHNTPSIWNSICTICQAFKDDQLFDVLFIGMGGLGGGVEHVGKYGYKYVVWNDYLVEQDKPDILILTTMFEKVVNPNECRKCAKLIVAASGLVIKYKNSVEEYWESQEKGFGVCQPDYYLLDSYIYNEVKASPYFSDKIIEMGNAKFDGIYQAVQKKQYRNGWEKLKGKKVVLWAEGHGVGISDELMKQVTFDLYAKTIFEYANDHHEIGIIFRPHLAFIQEMFDCEFWTENDLKRFKQYCEESPNIVFDDTDSYNYAFSIADGILTSAYCGIIYSSLPLLKPICVCYRSREDISYEAEMVKNYYSVYENKEIIDFLEMVKGGYDPMFELRKGLNDKYIKCFDGGNGNRIKEFIKNKYFQMI